MYTYNDSHPVDGPGFSENDVPNFSVSFYAKTKVVIEDILRNYPNVLILRLNMPISADLSCPRNFISKLLNYEHIFSVPNSFTVLPELLPLSLSLACKCFSGVINFTNPGAISHAEILQLYKDFIDPEFTWRNYSKEDSQDDYLKARSNNKLDTTRLQNEFPNICDIKSSLIRYVFQPANQAFLRS